MTLEPRLVARTPCAVQGLAWAPDGARLAVCGGHLYGGGFLHLLDHDLSPRAGLADRSLLDALTHDDDGPPHAVILSALCWDDAGQALLAAACGYKWHHRPPILFDVTGDVPRVAPLAPPPDDDDRPPEGHATGCWLHRGRIVLRRRTTELAPALTVLADPATAGLHADERRTALQNARLAIVRDVAHAAKNLANVSIARGLRPDGSLDVRPLPNPHGLVRLDLSRETAPHLTPLDPSPPLQALVRDPAGAALYAGRRDRTLLAFTLAGDDLAADGAFEHPKGSGADAGPVVAGVTALCFLADGATLVSADHAGAVHFWRDRRRIATAQIPGGQSPRALAADPARPRVVVGCKSGRGGADPGAVFVVDAPA